MKRDLKEMMAFCGLDCYGCGAFLATKENNDQKRAEVAQEWSNLFNVEIKPEDINCDGCQSDGGRLFNYPPSQNAPSARVGMNTKRISAKDSAMMNMLRRVSPKLKRCPVRKLEEHHCKVCKIRKCGKEKGGFIQIK